MRQQRHRVGLVPAWCWGTPQPSIGLQKGVKPLAHSPAGAESCPPMNRPGGHALIVAIFGEGLSRELSLTQENTLAHPSYGELAHSFIHR